MKKVLVTGISGYIGIHCAVELLKNGYKVRGSLRDLSKSKTIDKAIKKQFDPKKNLEFCMKYENNNKFLLKKLNWINSQLSKNKPTIPISLNEELKTNIFLRCNELSLKNALGMNNASDEAVFKKLRDLKDQF